MADGGTHHATNRKDITWIADCDGCDLEFIIDSERVNEDGEEALEDALSSFIEDHEQRCGGEISFVREDEQTEVLTDGGIPGAQRRSHYDESDDEPREPTRYERAYGMILRCTRHRCTWSVRFEGDRLNDRIKPSGALDADMVPRRCPYSDCPGGVEEELYDEDGAEVV